jgi:hypothetical protein
MTNQTTLKEASNGTPASGLTEVPWQEAQRVCDLPIVDEMIRNLMADSTNDNAVCLVREIMKQALDRKDATKLLSAKSHIETVLRVEGKELELGSITKLKNAIAEIDAAIAMQGEKK